MTTKKCSSCKHDQPIELFETRVRGNPPQKYQLRVCDMCYFPDKYGKKYCSICVQLKNISEFDKRKDSVNRNYKAACKSCVLNYAREYNAIKRYGMSLTELEELKTTQNGECAICGSNEKLVVDHNHSTGDVRAYLCDLCNRGLGYFRDNPQLLLTASNYLLNKGYSG